MKDVLSSHYIYISIIYLGPFITLYYIGSDYKILSIVYKRSCYPCYVYFNDLRNFWSSLSYVGRYVVIIRYRRDKKNYSCLIVYKINYCYEVIGIFSRLNFYDDCRRFILNTILALMCGVF